MTVDNENDKNDDGHDNDWFLMMDGMCWWGLELYFEGWSPAPKLLTCNIRAGEGAEKHTQAKKWKHILRPQKTEKDIQATKNMKIKSVIKKSKSRTQAT